MSFPPSLFKTYTAGETLTASDLNSSLTDITNTNIPEDIDDYSANTTEMRSTTDPYPASSESLATALDGEIARLRYVIAQISGETYWYQDPDRSIASLTSLVGTSTAQLLAPTGSADAPGLSAAGDPNSGLVIDNDTITAHTGGITRLTIENSLATFTTPIRTGAGDAANPSLEIGEDGLGWYRSGASNVALAVGSAQAVVFTSAGIRVGTGAVGGPSITSISASTTGLYWTTTPELLISVGGANVGTFAAAGLTLPGKLTTSELNLGDSTELTISSGAITVSQARHTVDTESNAASDDLDTINGGSDGDVIFIAPNNNSRTIVLKHLTGNIRCGADVTLDSIYDRAILVYDGNVSNWYLESYYNGA